MSFLTDADIERYTGRARHKDQVAELERLRIPYRINKRRQIVVLWSAVEAALGPRELPAGPTSEPDRTFFQ